MEILRFLGHSSFLFCFVLSDEVEDIVCLFVYLFIIYEFLDKNVFHFPLFNPIN